MIMVSFRNREDKEHLLKKAKKMEEYASMVVECLENSDYDEEGYSERSMRNYRDDDEEMPSRYGYHRYRRM